MLISAQYTSYQLPSGHHLFEDVQFTLDKGDKAAIVGHNGAGKSTLLRIIAGQEKAFSGTIHAHAPFYYVPQHFGHFNHLTVAAACGIADKLSALEAITNGDASEHWFDIIGDDWDIMARFETAIAKWGIPYVTPDQPLSALSGGEKTRLFLSGIDIFNPAVVLLDEPTNHLDHGAREQLYAWVRSTNCTLLIVSHDRELLRLCTPIWELQADGIQVYGGNYDLYAAQKEIATASLQQRIAHQEKTLREAKKQRQIAIERAQHADAQARKKSKTGGMPKILLGARKNAAEVSTAKLDQVHTEKVSDLAAELQEVNAMAQLQRIMKGYFEASSLHRGKVLAEATAINYSWMPDNMLWDPALSFTLRSGDRLAITGPNGAGKSTLLQLLLGHITPSTGELHIANTRSILLDQDYSLIDRSRTILEQALAFNENNLETSTVKSMLVNFLFGRDTWDKSCAVLSGGEMLRLALCSMTLQNKAPDMIMLDEPTNNLDLANIKILTQIFAEYKGTLLLISHDKNFIQDAGITGELLLKKLKA